MTEIGCAEIAISWFRCTNHRLEDQCVSHCDYKRKAVACPDIRRLALEYYVKTQCGTVRPPIVVPRQQTEIEIPMQDVDHDV